MLNLDQFKQDNKFLMLAFDHRSSYKKYLNPENPDSVTVEEASLAKKQILEALFDLYSAVLIDPEYGLGALDQIHKQKGTMKPFLLPSERSGTKDLDGGKLNDLEYDSATILEMGASGVKLLLNFNPSYIHADKQLELAKQVLESAHFVNLPLFLEFVTYPLEGEVEDRAKLVGDSIRYFQDHGMVPDVWKLEYPGSELECAKITEIVAGVPWVLLTRGVDFEQFYLQLRQARAAGCSGFLAGRALWQEAYKLDNEARNRFIAEELPARFAQICGI